MRPVGDRRAQPPLADGATRQARRQFHAEDLQQAMDFILEVDAFALHDFTAGQQGLQMMALDALHVNPTVPARAEDQGDAARVLPVGLVAHGRPGRSHFPGLHADAAESGFTKALTGNVAVRPVSLSLARSDGAHREAFELAIVGEPDPALVAAAGCTLLVRPDRYVMAVFRDQEIETLASSVSALFAGEGG